MRDPEQIAEAYQDNYWQIIHYTFYIHEYILIELKHLWRKFATITNITNPVSLELKQGKLITAFLLGFMNIYE